MQKFHPATIPTLTRKRLLKQGNPNRDLRILWVQPELTKKEHPAITIVISYLKRIERIGVK